MCATTLNATKPMIGITQRVTLISGINEKRDSLDQAWGRLMSALGLMWVALPNMAEQAVKLAERLELGGLILTGGDDIGVFPERDDTEMALLDWAWAQGRQIVGVCRGFQVIHTWLGGELVALEQTRHVRAYHDLRLADNRVINRNSYHAWGINKTSPQLQNIALCPEDNTIECAGNQQILGIMWHPEREEHFMADDLHLLRGHLIGKIENEL